MIGRVDYIALKGNGDIYAWRNEGVEDEPTNWTDLGLIKPANIGLPSRTNAQFATSSKRAVITAYECTDIFQFNMISSLSTSMVMVSLYFLAVVTTN